MNLIHINSYFLFHHPQTLYSMILLKERFLEGLDWWPTELPDDSAYFRNLRREQIFREAFHGMTARANTYLQNNPEQPYYFVALEPFFWV